jgi:hypothetical protein
MRHDEHYVEALGSAGEPVGRQPSICSIPFRINVRLWAIYPSSWPRSPKRIIEPLVRQRGNRYQIIAGERRYHAAVRWG